METQHDWVWGELWKFRYRLMKGPIPAGDARRRYQEHVLDRYAPQMRARIDKKIAEEITEASRQARLDEHKVLAALDEEGRKQR